MATQSYTTAEVALNEVANAINQQVQRMRQGKSAIDTAKSTLDGLPTQYADLIQYIDDQATANPDDEGWQALKRRKDKLAADFNARATTARDMQSALTSYNP